MTIKGNKDSQWILRLPNLNGNAKVLVNGKEVGVSWCSPWLLDVTKFLKTGVNRMEILVDNVLSNRMIGDAGLPEAERVTYAQPQIYDKDDSLKPSGIFGGPVKLERY